MMVVVIDQLQRWAHCFVRQPGEQRSAIAGCSLANPPLEAHDLCMWMVETSPSNRSAKTFRLYSESR